MLNFVPHHAYTSPTASSSPCSRHGNLSALPFSQKSPPPALASPRRAAAPKHFPCPLELNISFASTGLVARSVLVCNRSFRRQFATTVVSATPSGSRLRIAHLVSFLLSCLQTTVFASRQSLSITLFSNITTSSTCISASCCGSKTFPSVCHLYPFEHTQCIVDAAFHVSCVLQHEKRPQGWESEKKEKQERRKNNALLASWPLGKAGPPPESIAEREQVQVHVREPSSVPKSHTSPAAQPWDAGKAGGQSPPFVDTALRFYDD